MPPGVDIGAREHWVCVPAASSDCPVREFGTFTADLEALAQWLVQCGLISGGKVDLPALGFGMGDVVLLELLKERGLLPKFDSPMDVFVLIEDEALRSHSLKLVHDLRAAGFAVEYPLTPAKSDKQFKRAQELKVAHTALLENDSYVRIRDLQTRKEIVTGIAGAANHLG